MGKYPKTLRDVMRAVRSYGGLFGSQKFGAGEFPSLQQLKDSIYQVQTITLEDGRSFHKFIEHAVGSQEQPMTDKQLEDKFTGLAEEILPRDRMRRLMELCWSAWDLPDAGEIGRAGAAA